MPELVNTSTAFFFLESVLGRVNLIGLYYQSAAYLMLFTGVLSLLLQSGRGGCCLAPFIASLHGKSLKVKLNSGLFHRCLFPMEALKSLESKEMKW
jgi:hypothetical protein